MTGQNVSWTARLALAIIVLVALALRLWGAFFDLPYIYHPDEPQIVVAIQEMLTEHDPNPHLFLYPSLLYYVNILAALLCKALPAWASGSSPVFLEPISIAMGSTFALDADAVALYRLVSIIGGAASVFLMFSIGKRARGVQTGLAAALLAASSPLLVAHSRYVTPDGYVVFFELLTILASCSIVTTGRRISYVAAGIAIGAAAASKYNGAVVCIFPVAAHVLRFGLSPRASAPLWLTAAVSLLAFIVFNPFIVIDYQAALGVLYQFRTYSSPHQGMEGNAPMWYLQQLWLNTGLASILALGQIVVGWRRRCVPTIILASFTAIYFLFISLFTVRNDRTLLPLVPCILLLAALFLTDLASPLSSLRRISPALRRIALAVIAIALVLPPSLRTIAQAMTLTTVDSRATAREWINSELPAGALIAVESYAPFADPLRFRILQSERAIDHKPAWYVENGTDYVVLSQGMFGRYFDNPRLYAAEVLRYAQLVNSLKLVKRFNDGGYEIAVYQTNRADP